MSVEPIEQLQQSPRRAQTRTTKRPKSTPAPAEATPYARALFAQLTRPFIVPSSNPSEGLHLIFDLESDGLLETVTCVHCIVISELNADRVYEYGPDRIANALAHLARADTLIGHNIQNYDLAQTARLGAAICYADHRYTDHWTIDPTEPY